jgi:hypothetical protein
MKTVRKTAKLNLRYYTGAQKKKKNVSTAPLFIGGYTQNLMVMNRLQNSRRAPRVSKLNCQNIFFQMRTLFFSNSDRDFYFENNNVSYRAFK